MHNNITTINSGDIKRKTSDGDVQELDSVSLIHINSSCSNRWITSSATSNDASHDFNPGVDSLSPVLRERRSFAFQTSLSSPHSSLIRKRGSPDSPRSSTRFKTAKCVAFALFSLFTYSLLHNLVLVRTVSDNSRNSKPRDNYQPSSFQQSPQNDIVQSLLMRHIDRSVMPIFISIEDNEEEAIIQRRQILEKMTEYKHPEHGKQQEHQRFQVFQFSNAEQRHFLQGIESNDCFSKKNHSNTQQYDMQKHYVSLLWKYCSLYLYGGMYVDLSKVALLHHPMTLISSAHHRTASSNNSSINNNVLIVNSALKQVEESFMIWNEVRSPRLRRVLDYLVGGISYLDHQDFSSTKKQEIARRAFLFESILNTNNKGNIQFLEQRCYRETGLPYFHDILRCEVFNPQTLQIPMVITDPLDVALPFFTPCHSTTSKNCRTSNKHTHSNSDLAVIETTETTDQTRNATRQSNFCYKDTPTFFQMMLENDCLPSNRLCKSCLVLEGTCDKCRTLCTCYCNAICNPSFAPRRKLIQKKYSVKVPAQTQQFMIPRKIHQIWTDKLPTDLYPKMSRVLNSFKHSKWGSHYLWDLELDVPIFLKTHFPSEVLEAYNSLTLPRFKSDLARYCLLLIHGGVYAEPDIILNADLDNAIQMDIGFMAVVVNIARPMNGRQSSPCLWSAFLVSAPGHPFLAKLIEMIVNNIRNRFTSVDYDAMFCPFPPAFDLTWKHPNHLTTGSCILGAAVNAVLGRPLSSTFDAGDLPHGGHNSSSSIPGRTFILQPEFPEMTSLRFMNVQENVIIGTSVRNEVEKWPDGMLYTSASTGNTIKNSLYGRNGIYADTFCAHEDIILSVPTSDSNT